MMKIKRAIKSDIIEKINNTDKIVIIYGARQVGKTTLAKDIIQEIDKKTLVVNADQEKYIDILSSRDLNQMKSLVSGFDFLFIDEAQRVPNIGINLKILHDEIPEMKIIATGSSSFELANKIQEPLTGRTWSYNLFPISIKELSKIYNDFNIKELIDGLLVYGSYPEVFTSENIIKKEELLKELARSYIYKDIFDLKIIKQPGKVKDLLRLLAYQIGSEVSVHELANNLNIASETVERYIDMLEKAFVIFRLGGFSRNLRKEVSKMDKIYFYDTGIRNVVIDDFKPLKNRNDVGALWENFLVSERFKRLSYDKISAASYFWRTHTGAELDYIEDSGGKLYGYEFKYGDKKKKAPKSWVENYNGEFVLINKDNFLDFVL